MAELPQFFRRQLKELQRVDHELIWTGKGKRPGTRSQQRLEVYKEASTLRELTQKFGAMRFEFSASDGVVRSEPMFKTADLLNDFQAAIFHVRRSNGTIFRADDYAVEGRASSAGAPGPSSSAAGRSRPPSSVSASSAYVGSHASPPTPGRRVDAVRFGPDCTSVRQPTDAANGSGAVSEPDNASSDPSYWALRCKPHSCSVCQEQRPLRKVTLSQRADTGVGCLATFPCKFCGSELYRGESHGTCCNSGKTTRVLRSHFPTFFDAVPAALEGAYFRDQDFHIFESYEVRPQ